MTVSMLLPSNADANPPSTGNPTTFTIAHRPETPARRPALRSGGVQ